MKFEEAIKQMRGGRAVTLPYWNLYLRIAEGKVWRGFKDNPDGPELPLKAIACAGITAEDWEIYL
jgi:hypothetical protein